MTEQEILERITESLHQWEIGAITIHEFRNFVVWEVNKIPEEIEDDDPDLRGEANIE